MAYTIIGSEGSPFARICRMLMIQNSIEFDFKVLNIVSDANAAAALQAESPINKVPILVVGSESASGAQKIFDSRVIAGFLTAKHGLRKLSLDEENILSSIYSCMDTGVILYLLKRDGFDLGGPGFFISRNRARIPANLAWLSDWASGLRPGVATDWNFASMALYSFLYWADKREVFKLADYPVMAAFVDHFREAPGVRETSF